MNNAAQLIKVMGKRERAYFYQLNIQNKDKSYFKLFQLIVKNPEITLDKLSSSLSLKGGKPRLSVELNYLYNHLLRSLHIYRINTSDPISSLFIELQFVRILIEKKQIKLALKSLKNIKKKGYKFETYNIIILAISLEEEMLLSSFESNLNKRISSCSAERNACIALIDESNQLRLIRTTIIDLQYFEGLYIEKNNPKIACLFNPILHTETSKSIRIEESKLLSKSVGYLLIGEYEKSRTEMLKRIEIIRKNQLMFGSMQEIYSINNFLYLSTLSKSVKDFEWQLKELLLRFKEFNTDETVQFSMKYYLKLRMNCVINNKKQLRLILAKLNKEPEAKFELLSETEKNELYHNIVWANILINDIDSAFTYINRWLNFTKENLNYMYSRIFRLIVFYQNKEFKLLAYEAKTVLENFKKKRLNTAPVKLFMQFIKRELAGKRSTKENIQLFREDLIKIEHLPETKCFQFEFYFEHWLDGLKMNK